MLDSGYRNHRGIIITGDRPGRAKSKLFRGEKTQPEAGLKLAVACARVARIIRMASPLAHFRTSACLTWSWVACISFLTFDYILAVWALLKIPVWCFVG